MRRLLGMANGAFRLDELPGDVEKRGRGCHTEKGAISRDRGCFVALVVANKWRAGQIKVKLLLRLIKKPGLRFAAVTTALPVMRAIVDCINSTARLRYLLLHAIMNGNKLGLTHSLATDARLVGGDDGAKAGLIQKAQRIERAWTPLPLTPVSHVLRLRRPPVEDAVAIENNRRLSPHEG